MLRLTSVSTADAAQYVELAASVLTEQQFRIWYLKTHTPNSMFAIRQALAAEGYAVSLRTLEREWARIQCRMDQALLKQAEEQAQIRLGVTIQTGAHTAKYREDDTAHRAHTHLGSSLAGSLRWGERRAA